MNIELKYKQSVNHDKYLWSWIFKVVLGLFLNVCAWGNFNLNTTGRGANMGANLTKIRKLFKLPSLASWFIFFFQNQCSAKKAVFHPFELVIHPDCGRCITISWFHLHCFLRIFCSSPRKTRKNSRCNWLSFWSCPLEGTLKCRFKFAFLANKTTEAQIAKNYFNFHKI